MPVQQHRDQADAYTVLRGFDFQVRATVPGLVDKGRRFSEGVIAFKPRLSTDSVQVGLADQQGRVLGRYPFDLIKPMHEGLAAFQQSEPGQGQRRFQFGYLDRPGKIAIPASFSGATAFSEGRAVVIARHNLGLNRPPGQGPGPRRLALRPPAGADRRE